MFEVKLTLHHSSFGHSVVVTQTIATFDKIETSSQRYIIPSAEKRAIKFAKLIDKGYAVDVINVEEENVAPLFGLVYHRDADLS